MEEAYGSARPVPPKPAQDDIHDPWLLALRPAIRLDGERAGARDLGRLRACIRYPCAEGDTDCDQATVDFTLARSSTPVHGRGPGGVGSWRTARGNLFRRPVMEQLERDPQTFPVRRREVREMALPAPVTVESTLVKLEIAPAPTGAVRASAGDEAAGSSRCRHPAGEPTRA